MTTITVKQLHRPTREWRYDGSIFKEYDNRQPASVKYSCNPDVQIFDKSSFVAIPSEIAPIGDWLYPTAQKISSLPFHTDNWSTGAKRTEPGAIKQLLNILSQILPDEAPAPAIVPTWLGGVQAEWHCKGVDLEIFVNPGEPVGYYFNSNDTEQEGVASDDWAKLRGYAEAIV